MSSVRLDLSFEHDYEVQLGSEVPGGHRGVRQIHYPGAGEGVGAGLLVRISPHQGEPWLGSFAPGEESSLSGAFSHPDPATLCVVSRGRGYLVRADSPSQWEYVQAYPVRDVRLVLPHRLVVFADLCCVMAYGPGGARWKTARLSWDGVEITGTDAGRLTGLAWDAPAGQHVGFSVDLETGRHEGGASPEA